MRRLVPTSVLGTFLLALGPSMPVAAASDAPKAKQLVKTLIAADVCRRLEIVDAAEHEVICTTTGHGKLPIRVTALRTHRALVGALAGPSRRDLRPSRRPRDRSSGQCRSSGGADLVRGC